MARTLVGLDVGSSGIRAAEFALGRRNPRLRRFASVPLAAGAVTAGVVTDPEAVTAGLRTLWSQGRFRTRTVVLGIANASVLVRQMDLDWMPPADFRKALRYQVEDVLPVPVDETNLDYHLLEEIDVEADGAARKVARVLLVAAGREMVDGFVTAAHGAGLRPVRVDLVPFALIRAAARVPGATPGPEAIVDIGAETVTVAVHEGGRPQHVRTVPGLGGAVVTRALQERYEWTWEEAERTKVVVGLPGHGEVDHPAQAQVAAEVEALVGEVRATLDYFRSQDGSPELTRVLLTGDGSRLPGLPVVLAERLGLPVEPFAVAGGLRAPRRLRGGDHALNIPAGLCIGASAS
ncbi:MAG TPA: type IV pilus assembly protein PilM [Nocardioidaceae bacterium]|nr:type IV pilus assembly protein PilM [Nocardioidaceae bacterium]